MITEYCKEKSERDGLGITRTVSGKVKLDKIIPKFTWKNKYSIVVKK